MTLKTPQKPNEWHIQNESEPAYQNELLYNWNWGGNGISCVKI